MVESRCANDERRAAARSDLSRPGGLRSRVEDQWLVGDEDAGIARIARAIATAALATESFTALADEVFVFFSKPR